MQFHRHQGSAGEVMKLARQVAGDNRILPLSRAMVEGVATCVKESGMKSGVQYLTALKLLHYFKAQSGVELGELSLVINYSQVVLACHD